MKTIITKHKPAKGNIHFESLRKGIFNELLRASQHFKIFWDLHTADKEIANVRNAYLSFFVYTMSAHHNHFYISIYNITKYDHCTSNFPRLLAYIKSNAVLSKLFSLEQIDSISNILLEHEELIRRIGIIRDQYIAHNQLRKRHLGISLKYKYEEGDKLLKDFQKMLNSLSSSYDGNKFFFDVIPHLNIEQMLADLTKYRQYKINNLRKMTSEL